MFRQIRVVQEDRDLKRIVWSPRPVPRPEHYRLTTVTYGTACAPYLAIRTLQQLARDEGAQFPLGAECLLSNTYIDDMFTGADELATAIRKRDELVGILKSARIELDKWAANNVELLPASLPATSNGAVKSIDSDKAVKTLRVHWNPASDEFNFSVAKLETDVTKLTKRAIYSDISRLFDPLGWLAPITVIAKIIMQDLWIVKREWDELLPEEIRTRWLLYCQSLLTLPTLSINRWLSLSSHTTFEIHGFSDASSRAYAATVYLRINDGSDRFRVSLLSAKTKVSPVKTVSIPNLELLGATLLVKLVCHLQKLEFLKNAPARLWTDSQIVLMWLKKHPWHWKTFVANRVSLIQTELPAAIWSHVPTKQNPADIASRGASPTELKSTDLWWHRPTWLAEQPLSWPQSPKPVQCLHLRPKVSESKVLLHYSKLKRLIHGVAWFLRPAFQFIRKRAGQGSYPTFLTVAELDNAREAIVRLAQSHAYSHEIGLLRAGKALPKRHPLCKLRPFLESDGILRVGGRLSNANVPCHVQFPPILPRLSPLSRLFVLDAHERALHGGPTVTTSILLRNAWIVGMRPLVKSVIHQCVKCQRHKPRLAHQLMGDLPAARVTSMVRPFTTAGLDYAGPFKVLPSKARRLHAAGQVSRLNLFPFFFRLLSLFLCWSVEGRQENPLTSDDGVRGK